MDREKKTIFINPTMEKNSFFELSMKEKNIRSRNPNQNPTKLQTHKRNHGHSTTSPFQDLTFA